MQHQNQEILAIIILGALLALLLVGFIISMLFLYKKRQQQHIVEMTIMEEEYNQQILRVQFEMQEAVLAEISDKLHDALKGSINSVVMGFDAVIIRMNKNKISLNETQAILTESNETLKIIREEVRLTSHSLSSDKISKAGLIDAIKHEASRIDRNKQFKVSIVACEIGNLGFKQEESVYLFRMFQEVLTNIYNHSKATEIDIKVDIDAANYFMLQIADNGIGFNVEEKKKSKLSGIGLNGLEKRALQMGADLQILSLPNIGTTIKIKLLLTEPVKTEKNVEQKRKTNYSFD